MSTIIGLVSTFRLPLHFSAPFGLPRAFPPLQRPIHHFFPLLLDFHTSLLHLKVQSASLKLELPAR